MNRPRLGETLALVGALALLVLLFLDWFAAGPIRQTGWAALGWFMDLLLVALALGGIAVMALSLGRIAPAWPVGSCVLTGFCGVLVTLGLAVVLLLQPGLGVEAPNRLVDVRWPALVGLLATALIPVGAFTALDDERPGAPESAVTPPPARPVPGT